MGDFSKFDESCEPGFFNLASLSKYKKKRQFKETSEPEGKVEEGKNKHRFVIQLHHAKKAGDHFDLRLENDKGTMSSWAIPKHTLPNKNKKLLAIEVEDHPLSYRTFEGKIPEGEYGAGTVDIYDSGTYEEIEKSPSKIIFKLNGKKEKGAYTLFRENKNKWLIMKHTEKKALLTIAKYLEKKEEESGNITYIYSKEHIKRRNKKKATRLKRLNKALSRLRDKIKKDIKSDNLQKAVTALAVEIIDETYSRVGNEESARELKHYGLTTWEKRHISFSNGKAKIKFVGKSGVDQSREVKDKDAVNLLKQIVKDKKPNDRIFEGENYNVKASHINKYLDTFNISAKDIRGFHANEEMINELHKIRKGKLPSDLSEREKKLKEEFKKALERASANIGHQPNTLKNQYLLSSIEPDYLKDGKIGTLADDGMFADDIIPGGLADNKSDSDFTTEQLRKGIKVEMEHTNDPMLAKEIAKDHLTEDSKYYDKLAKIESHSMFIPLSIRIAAKNKVSKKDANYQENPNDGKHCSMCVFFQSPDRCIKVEGKILPNGWCKFWKSKK